MAQTSIGFNGSISAVQWAQFAALLMSSAPLRATPTDCKITAVGGARQVSIATGSFGQDGVVTTVTSAETVTIPTPTNGQWYLVVNKRTWASGTSAFEVRNGPTTSATYSAVTSMPTAYPASLLTSPGTSADVPVAWVWASSSTTVLAVFPILQAPAGRYPRRGTPADRSAYYDALTPLNAGILGTVWLAAVAGEWLNTTANQREWYQSQYDATVNPGVPVGQTSGWVQPFYDSGWLPLPAPSGGYTGQSGQDVGVRLKNGIVMTRGQNNRNTPASNSVAAGDRIATFPVGMRPSQIMLLPAKGESGVDMLLKLFTNGDLTVFRTSSTTGKYIILDNLEWFADQ